MHEHPEAVVVEVAAPEGGAHVLTRKPSPGQYREAARDTYELELLVNARAQRWRAGRAGALLGALAPMIVTGLFVYTCVGGNDLGGSCWGMSLCFVPFTVLIGYAIGKRKLALRPPAYHATFHDDVVIDGRDLGRLLRVESDVVTSTVLLVMAHGEERIRLASPEDAVVLADALGAAVPREKSGSVAGASQADVDSRARSS